jgi:hypothetical protein
VRGVEVPSPAKSALTSVFAQGSEAVSNRALFWPSEHLERDKIPKISGITVIPRPGHKTASIPADPNHVAA